MMLHHVGTLSGLYRIFNVGTLHNIQYKYISAFLILVHSINSYPRKSRVYSACINTGYWVKDNVYSGTVWGPLKGVPNVAC